MESIQADRNILEASHLPAILLRELGHLGGQTEPHICLNQPPRQAPGHGFYLDGYYFGLLVAKTMPRNTWAKTMEPFLALTIPNLRVVVNMQPLPVESEIRYEEERFSKLISNIDPKSPCLQSEVGLDKHRERMRLLMSNKVIPFEAQLIVIACDRTPDGLDARMEALRAALGKTGAEPFQPSYLRGSIF